MSEFSFGMPKNTHVCKCGLHHGTGEWTAEQRVAYAKRMSLKMPTLMTDNQIAFLKHWEEHHGSVKYEMGVVGLNDGSFDRNKKGRDVIGPLFVPPYEPKTDDLFKRKDING